MRSTVFTRRITARTFSFLLVICMILTSSSCGFLPKAKDEYKDLLNLPTSYLSPIEAQWASVFLPPQLPVQSKTEGRFLNAWNKQATYILARMQKINDQGHLFHEALLKTAEMLMGVSGTPKTSVRQIAADYTDALLQADISAGLYQSDKIKDKSQKAIMAHNWLLASAHLVENTSAATNELINVVLAEEAKLSQEEFIETENDLIKLLTIHSTMLIDSHQMVEAHIRLKVADQVLGDLYAGAVLAEVELARNETDNLLAEKKLNKQTAAAVNEQLQNIHNHMSDQPDMDIYAAKAKGFIEMVSAVEDVLFAPIDYLVELTTEITEPVVKPIREEFSNLIEAIDQGSDYRISEISDMMTAQVDALAEYLGIERAESAQALRAAALAANELGRADGPQLQLISDAAMAELDYIDRKDNNLPHILEANGYHLLAQMAGYMQTLHNDSLDWLDSAITKTTDLLTMPTEEEMAQNREEILQLAALMNGQEPSESEVQYISDLLGVYYDDIKQALSDASLSWLQELQNLGGQFGVFIGPDAVNVLNMIDRIIVLPADILNYPISGIDAALTTINRYAEAQGNRMLLSLLEGLHELYIEVGMMDPVKINLDGLLEELDQKLNGYLDMEAVAELISRLAAEETEQALLEYLSELEEEEERQINSDMIDRLMFLLDLLGINPFGPPVDEEAELTTSDTAESTETPDITDTTPSAAVPEENEDDWFGHWSGQMAITTIDRPDVYSPEEQQSLLNSTFPMEFIIGHNSDGEYTIDIIENKGGEVTFTIDGLQITIQFRSKLPDNSDIIYQNFVGELTEDKNIINGNVSTGAESVGDFYSGVWTVSRNTITP